MRRKAILVLVVVVLFFGSLPITFATTASFQGLGELPGGDFYSAAQGVSADGSVVVGQSGSASGYEAFRWEDGVITPLGVPSGGGSNSEAYGVSADGSVVVGYSGYTAFRWEAGVMTSLGGSNSKAMGVSADGSVVVGYGDSPLGREAFRWEDGVMTGLGDLPGGDFQSWAYGGVSADGSVVAGGSSSASGYEAFRWTETGGMVGLGDLSGGSYWSQAKAVSADGAVVVGFGHSGPAHVSKTEAFRWEGGVMTGLGDLPGGSFESIANGVSADGSVVVGEGDSSHGAFIWDADNGMRNLRDVLVNDFSLDLTGWTLNSAEDISNDGLTIVGWGYNPDGYIEGWIATIAEPTIGGYIDCNDLAIFSDKWLDSGCSDANNWCGRADINRDNYVDFVDFAWLAQYWEDAAPAPGRAGNPDPPYIGLPVVSIAADLSWTAGSDAAAHGVYFGTNPTPDANEFQGYQTSTTFDPGLMIGGTTYYWQVDEVGLGGEMAGEVWSFTTAPAPGQATNPIPADGESIDGYEYLLEPYSIYTILDFTAGDGAVSHEAFFSDDEAKVTARDPTVSLGEPGSPPTTYYVGLPIPEYTPYTDSLVRGTWYYWCVDETDDQGQVWPGPVWSFYLRLDKALDPDPPDGQTFVSLTPTLSWGGGVGAEFHDVYFGYTFADVNDANMLEADPEFRDTQILHDTDWEPVADGGLFLDYETTYYWRIDEVRGRMLPIKPGTVVKGDIWSFTTHPFIHPTYPVGWWSFDEGEGSLAFDRSGHGNHGMLIDGIDNGLAWAPAEGALNFDGSNNLSRVMIPASAMTTTAGTIAIWANLTGPQIRDGGRNGSGYFFGCDNGGNDKILLYMDSSDTQLDMKVGNHGENNIVTLSTETWYHMALTWNGGVYAVYVNGLNLDTGSYGGLTSLPSTADIGNNGSSSTQSFHGLMGDVQVYDKSLSAAEIQQLCQDVAN